MNDIDKFYPVARNHGDSVVITIPSNLVKGLGIKEGDGLKVWIKKEVVDKDK